MKEASMDIEEVRSAVDEFNFLTNEEWLLSKLTDV
jgi:hypothetical protein